ADAAIAVQLVLGLVEPQSSGLGGGAFVLHWSEKARRVRSYDARETAPAAARLLELLHREHGRLPWARLFEPAIRLAHQGFIKTRRLARMLERFPEVRALFPLNREYAATLRTLAAQGADAFYRGE